MTIIISELTQINKDYEGLEWDILIPCNCGCIETELEFYRWEKLKKWLRRSPTIECHESGKKVEIRSLIDDVFGQLTVSDENQMNSLKDAGSICMSTQFHFGTGDNTSGDSNTNYK